MAIISFAPALWCAILATMLQLSAGANILAIFPFQARSHTLVSTPLMLELAKRGHQVTMLSHYPQKEISNFTDITIKSKLMDLLIKEGQTHNMFDQQDVPLIVKIFFMWHKNTETCDIMLQEEEIQKLIHSKDKHFDLIIMEAFFNECFLGFVHKFKAPLIYFSTFGGTHWMGDWVGNPNPYSYVTDVFLDYGPKMSLWQRTVNTLLGTVWRLGRHYYYLPKQNAVMRKHFNNCDDLPYAADIEYSTSLVLLNHHFSISYSKPLMPNIVQVGGLHVKPPQELPKDLKKYLDEATDGIIYFSMGSNLRSAQLPEDKRDAFLKVFSELKHKVLWKWEADTLPGQPKNVRLEKWLPQSDILAHPNVRLFMTHGGLLSTQEAINRGVPLLGIPVFGDQSLNMANAQNSGYGVMLPFDNVTTETLRWAIQEALGNSKYGENVKRLSRIFHDQPITPMEQAVYWTEYVIRHKGAKHMRSAALDLTWYQYLLLDVTLVLALAAGFIIIFPYILLKKLCCRKRTVVKSSKKRD